MGMKKNSSERISPGYFEFKFDVDESARRVTLWDGADAYTFILRDGKPFVTARPGERDISKQKWSAMMAQAAAILARLHDQTPG